MTVINAKTIDHVLHALEEQPGALLVQGGTDAMVGINFGAIKPTTVVSLRLVDELRSWHRNEDGSVFIGAGLPYAEMETGQLATLFPALADAARTVGSPQIRAAGTIGGNLGTCSPAGDALPVLAALDATIALRSLHGSRTVAFQQFMTGPKRSIMDTNELITGVNINPTKGFQGYAKVGVRNAMVISVASVCLVTDTNTQSVRIALGSVGPTIIRCLRAEAHLQAALPSVGRWHLSDDLVSSTASIAALEAQPIDDHRSTAQYRRHAVSTLVHRLLERSNDV